MAPMAAPNTANPVRSQNSSKYSGKTSRKTSSAAIRIHLTTEPRRRPGAGRDGADAVLVAPAARETVCSDTGQLLGAEEPRRPDQQDGDHDDVGDDLAEATAQEQQVLLVARGQGLGDPDEQAAHQRTAGGVQAAQ